eukprot:TRINITY_DN77749_c0_g1_i1.p1 TRINITY_DN77749_c0_g1~~TRINITY_DN77749_c0_g1_i1.p1  ORF type:complete len:221 (+),score=63.63 TRINITY_DN77749_c0_g1_i1:94-756(+)
MTIPRRPSECCGCSFRVLPLAAALLLACGPGGLHAARDEGEDGEALETMDDDLHRSREEAAPEAAEDHAAEKGSTASDPAKPAGEGGAIEGHWKQLRDDGVKGLETATQQAVEGQQMAEQSASHFAQKIESVSHAVETTEQTVKEFMPEFQSTVKQVQKYFAEKDADRPLKKDRLEEVEKTLEDKEKKKQAQEQADEAQILSGAPVGKEVSRPATSEPAK